MEVKKIHTTKDLEEAIKALEIRKENEEELIKLHFHELIEKLKPSNLVKETVAEVSESMDFKKNLFNIALGLGVGYLSKRAVVGQKAAGIGKQLLGTALEFGIANFVARKSGDMTSANGSSQKGSFLKRLFTRL